MENLPFVINVSIGTPQLEIIESRNGQPSRCRVTSTGAIEPLRSKNKTTR